MDVLLMVWPRDIDCVMLTEATCDAVRIKHVNTDGWHCAVTSVVLRVGAHMSDTELLMWAPGVQGG